jgi:hypothetical protein
MENIAHFRQRLQPAPKGGGYIEEDYWVWCGSVAQGEDARYHMFASRWPKSVPFVPNWVTNSEVVRASADRPEGPYAFEEVVLPPRAGAWDATMTHNPTIHYHDGTWILFYIGVAIELDGSDAPINRAASTTEYHQAFLKKRTGIATAPHITGPWTRRDQPILEPRPDHWDKDIISNPAPAIRPDGSVVMLYKSTRNRHSTTPKPALMLGVAGADHWSGPYRRLADHPIDQLNGVHADIEDPYIWWQDDHFEAVFKDMTGEICGSFYGGVHAWSADGITWETAPDPLAYTRDVLWDDGTTTHQGMFERPELLIQNGRPTHLFAATGPGAGGHQNMERSWNMVIPLSDSI